MKGTEIIVKALKEEGVDTIFGYPGGQAVDICWISLGTSTTTGPGLPVLAI